MKRAIIVLAFLTGCGGGGQIPPTHEYLLRPAEPGHFGADAQPSTIALGTVKIAPYLDRPGLVTASTEGTVSAARYHRWAEPLRESLRFYLANEISRQARQSVRGRTIGELNWKRSLTHNIDIYVAELHGTPDGSVRLVAYWAVVDPQEGTVRSEHEYTASQRLAAAGFEALVDAQKILLTEFAGEIARTL